MGFLSIMGNSFGCSASGERLVSATRDGDLQEAKALLEYNPRLARYSTFGFRNSPLHYSAAQGHHEIVSLLESADNIDASLPIWPLGRAVVQTLILFKDNIHRTDYINGGTALHFAALNGHTRCIRILLADYLPSISYFWNTTRRKPVQGAVIPEYDKKSLHMAALNGHAEAVRLLLDMGTSSSDVTVEDGTTIDLIGSGSTALHYVACGGNVLSCGCQLLLARGASLSAENGNGECGWRNTNDTSACIEPCAVCLERKCTVAAEDAPGSIPCPHCRHSIISFVKLPGTSPIRELPRTKLTLSLCTTCPAVDGSDVIVPTATQFCKSDILCTSIPPLGFIFLQVIKLSEISFGRAQLYTLHGSSRDKPLFGEVGKISIQFVMFHVSRRDPSKVVALCIHPDCHNHRK